MSWPTIQDVIAYLNAAGEINMATVVENLVDLERRGQMSAEKLLKAYRELQDKYEPRPRPPASYVNNWTGD